MAQPSLSRQIRQFEDEIGVELFHRVGRGMRLTEAERFLLEQSLQMTQRLEETIEATRRIGRKEKRWFGIGFVPSVLHLLRSRDHCRAKKTIRLYQSQ